MIVERHVSPDGVLTFVVARLDDGVILLGFEGGEWHTHPNLGSVHRTDPDIR